MKYLKKLNYNNNCTCIEPFRIQSAAVYTVTPLVTIISPCKNDLQLDKCTPYQHLDCNTPTYDRSQMRSGQRSKLRLSILLRDTNTLAVGNSNSLELIIFMV